MAASVIEIKDESNDIDSVPGSKTDVKELDCHQSLIKGLNKLYNDESTSDVTLVVGSHRYHVHKTILAASSEYFLRMFYGGKWIESESNEIVLQETPECEDVFDMFLRFFYSGSVNICPDNAPALLILADKYGATVKQDCLEFMTKTVNQGNVEKALAWIAICNQTEAMDVLERCHTIICFNLEKAAQMPGWISLTAKDILNILKHEEIVAESEYNIYVAVETWVLSQMSCECDTIKDLLSLVQFNNMKASELGKVQLSTLAKGSASEILKDHLFEGFRNLAFRAEFPDQEIPCSNRIYTSKHMLKKVVFVNESTTISPRGDFTNANEYTWNFIYQEDFPGLFSFEINVPKVSRRFLNQYSNRYSTTALKTDIPGTVRVNLVFFLLNSQEFVVYIENTSKKTEMPTTDLCTLVNFVKGEVIDFKPTECLVSFEIKKDE